MLTLQNNFVLALCCYSICPCGTSAIETSTADNSPSILVVGDSILSGQGAFANLESYPEDSLGSTATTGDDPPITYTFTPLASGECWRATDNSIGGRLAAALERPLVNLACAGAKAEHIIEQIEYAQQTQGLDDAIILFNVGGNDGRELQGFGNPLEDFGTCLRDPSFLQFWHPFDTEPVLDWSALQARMGSAFAALTAAAPASATIFVIGYPLLYRPLFDTSLCFFPDPCARRTDAVLTRTNGILAELTMQSSGEAAADIQFVAMDGDDMLLSGICSPLRLDVHGIVLDGLNGVSPSTFHPTERGYLQMYEQLSTVAV